MAVRTSVRLVLATLAVAAIAAGSFFLGVRVGAHQYVLLQSTVSGALLVGELRALRAGHSDRIIYGKELELDAQVLNFYRFETAGYPWLLWPHSEDYDHARYLRSIGRYRMEHPPVLSTSEVVGTDEVAQQMRQNNVRINETTKRIIESYAR